MSKLKELRSKGEKIVLSNNMEMEVLPLTMSEEADIAEMLDEEDTISMRAIAHLVKNAIRRAFPDASEEDIESVNKEDLKKITNAVLKINGLVSSPNPEGESESSTRPPSETA